MTAHTPGPWSQNGWTQKDDRIAIGAKGTALIAYVPSRDVSYNEQKANADLIAASPDMYEAIEHTLSHVDTCHKAKGEPSPKWTEMLRAAIVKAKPTHDQAQGLRKMTGGT